MMHYLSRAFVEFGPFTTEELTSFQQRGILKDTDYVRSEGSEEWSHVNDWTPAPVAPAAVKPAPVKKAKASEPAAVTAKKPAVKKTKKAA